MKRILLVNALPLIVLVVTLLYLNQFQNSLLETEVNVLRGQAKIYTEALSQTAIKNINENRFLESGNLLKFPSDSDEDHSLSVELARPLLISLTNPSPLVHAKVFNTKGHLVIDSQRDRTVFHRHHHNQQRELIEKKIKLAIPLSIIHDRNKRRNVNIRYDNMLEQLYDRLMRWLPYVNSNHITYLEMNEDPDFIPDKAQFLKFSEAFRKYESPPYIRRTVDYRLLITVSEPIIYQDKIMGIVQLTREAQDIDRALFSVRSSILVIFLLALAITVFLSWYLALTIAKPLLSLANAAYNMHKLIGGNGMVPDTLLVRKDEIGDLAKALQGSARALWMKMGAIERFAADVSHELKNPLSSIRSAIELLPRVKDEEHRKRLLFIITDDVKRLDRLITDIASSSRIETEMSRVSPVPVPVVPIFYLLAEMNAATCTENDPSIIVDIQDKKMAKSLKVMAIEDRLVQVLRNLIGNASSFSPPNGKIILSASIVKKNIEITVSDEGDGIPENKLDSIFERFYTERPEKENFGQHSGLGLSICRQIVVALKGSIRANNRYDADGKIMGAVFTVSLPKA